MHIRHEVDNEKQASVDLYLEQSYDVLLIPLKQTRGDQRIEIERGDSFDYVSCSEGLATREETIKKRQARVEFLLCLLLRREV